MRGASVRKFSRIVRVAAIASISIVAFFFAACQMNAPLDQPVAKSLEDARCLPEPCPPGNPPASPALLGSAGDFVVLGATTVTNAGPSVFTGDVGVYPGIALTGFQPAPFNTIVLGPGGSVTYLADGGLVNGTIYAGGIVGSVVEQAHADAVLAYNYLQAQPPDVIYSGAGYQLDTLTFTPGVYKFDPSANLAVGGTVYLDFQGNSDAVFIFQMGSTLVTMLDSKVVAINPTVGATCSGANVFWAVGSSATIDGAEFIGTVIAWTTITQTSAANTPVLDTPLGSVSGRLFALNGAVTMSTLTIAICAGSGGGTVPPDPDCKPYKDYVTGGGWIDTGSGWRHKRDKATFGVSGGIKNGKYWGQLSFNDHDGVKVKSTKVTAYKVIDSVTRQIEGIAKINGRGSFTYVVVVADKGERGRYDTFSLVLENGYSISGRLDGGNIQLHTKWDWDRDDHRKDLEAEDYVDLDEQEGISNSDL